MIKGKDLRVNTLIKDFRKSFMGFEGKYFINILMVNPLIKDLVINPPKVLTPNPSGEGFDGKSFDKNY